MTDQPEGWRFTAPVSGWYRHGPDGMTYLGPDKPDDPETALLVENLGYEVRGYQNSGGSDGVGIRQWPDRRSDGYERIKAAVDAALADARVPLENWRDAVEDATDEIDRIVDRNAHPDDVGHARIAMGLLARVWFSDDEIDSLYLGTEP